MFNKYSNTYGGIIPIRYLLKSFLVYLNKVFFLLESFRKELPKIFVFFLLSALLDVLGIAAVIKAFSFLVTAEATVFPSEFAFGEFLTDLDPNAVVIGLAIFLISLYSIKFIVTLLIEYALLDFCARVSVDLRHKLFKAYMKMPLLKFYGRDSGEYLDTMHRRVAQFAQTTLFSLLRILSDLITIIALLIVIGISFPAGTLIVAFAGAVLLTAYFLILGSPARHFGRLCNTRSASLLQFFKDGLMGKREISVYGKEDDFASETGKRAMDFARANRNSVFLANSSKFVLEFFLVVGLVGCFVVVYLFPQSQSYFIPFISAFSFAAIRMITAGYQIGNGLIKLQSTRPSVDDLCGELLSLKGLITAKTDSVSKAPFDFRKLELKAVSFSYGKDNDFVLKDIDLVIKKGSIITLIGESGSGKSTLLDLILGLTTPDTGEIKVNGLNFVDIASTWQENIAFCPQQPFICKETLFRNITLDFKFNGKDKLNTWQENRLTEALHFSQLDRTPLGNIKNIQRDIFDGGSNISGGQRQRVGLTRSFYSEREVIVFDEPTSALDQETESEVFSRLRELSGEKTIILSSHSSFAFEISDEVYSISNGTLKKVK